MVKPHFLVILLMALLPVVLTRTFFENEYLYASMEQDEVWPVVEYTRPGDVVIGADGQVVLPDFLSDPHSGHRVVEFYAPWCPHCKHFKNHFISFARNTSEIAKSLNLEIAFHAISCTVHKQLCQKFDVQGYPSIRIFRAGDLNGTSVTYWKLHPFQVLQSLGVDSSALGATDFSLTTTDVGDAKHHHGYNRRTRTKEEIYLDAMLSFNYAMRHSIFMTIGPLKNTTNDALYEWLGLLQDTLPPQWNIHKPLSDILKHMDQSPLAEKTLVHIMDQYEQPKDHNTQWSLACTHGDNFAGYTCGLWELFHIMTVGVVEWNNLVTSEAAIIKINAAADILHDYVSNFFACDVCRQNFISEYDACAYERCTRLAGERTNDWKQLPLWLWETHNGVNVRLMKEQAERDGKLVTDEDEVGALWPSRAECAQCWGKDGTWDEEFMYKYLRMEYWPEDEESARFRRDLPLVDPGTTDDDDDTRLPSVYRMILVLPVAILLTAILLQCIKKWNRIKTGRHKKSDRN